MAFRSDDARMRATQREVLRKSRLLRRRREIHANSILAARIDRIDAPYQKVSNNNESKRIYILY